VTIYALDDRGSICGRDKDFLFASSSRPALRPPSLLIASSMGSQAAGASSYHSTTLSLRKRGALLPPVPI